MAALCEIAEVRIYKWKDLVSYITIVQLHNKAASKGEGMSTVYRTGKCISKDLWGSYYMHFYFLQLGQFMFC